MIVCYICPPPTVDLLDDGVLPQRCPKRGASMPIEEPVQVVKRFKPAVKAVKAVTPIVKTTAMVKVDITEIVHAAMAAMLARAAAK